MIGRLRKARGGGTAGEAADIALRQGMADVLAALDDVIDDEAALASIYAGVGNSARPGEPAAPRRRLTPRRLAVRRLTPRQLAPRQLALRSAAGAAVALAAGVVTLVAVGVPGAGPGSTAGAVNTAYVVNRVDRALRVAGPGAIAQMTVTTRGTGGTTTAREWSYGDQWRSITNSSAGQPAYDEGLSHGVYTVVSYPTRAWARQRESSRLAAPALGPSGCEPAVAGFPLFPSGLPVIDVAAGSLPAAVARDLRAAISCGALAWAGRQRVDGIDAIKLTTNSGSPIAETIWVSPGTYLPVRVVIRPAPGQQGPWQTADITWLAPTGQNLARLTVPVPAGFRHVRLMPLVHHLSGGSAIKLEPTS